MRTILYLAIIVTAGGCSHAVKAVRDLVPIVDDTARALCEESCYGDTSTDCIDRCVAKSVDCVIESARSCGGWREYTCIGATVATECEP